MKFFPLDITILKYFDQIKNKFPLQSPFKVMIKVMLAYSVTEANTQSENCQMYDCTPYMAWSEYKVVINTKMQIM